MSDPYYTDVAKTGIEGLDDILCGGLTPHRLYLVEGVPGSGKTTLAMQCLMEGARKGETVLYVTLSETEEELRAIAVSHGWDLTGVSICELVPTEETLQPAEQYTMFHPADVELSETTRTILTEVERLKPNRVVLDSLSELRLLAGDPLRYRRQLLGFKQFFRGRKCTLILLDDLTGAHRDLQVQSIAHGVVTLEQLVPEYGADRRRVRVLKHRGRRYRGGYHDYTVATGGLDVFPRLIAAEHRRPADEEKSPTGVGALDQLLGGGFERGSSTLIVGAAGTGKSSLAAQYVAAAAARGQHSVMCIFDESRNMLLSRMRGLGIPLEEHVEAGIVQIRQVDPAELTPGEFAHAIRRDVEHGASIVVIDSLNGYLNAMPGERYLTVHLHELLMFLGERGVSTILVGAHQGMIGPAMIAPVDASYLADTVILLRYFETRGEVRQAISVMKKRGGQHERSIRDFSLQPGGIRVGPPLRNFRGILTGVPVESKDDAAPVD
ncbi:MAG TPA: ATPase domain-containing protein [Usitatibacter sp.]|jgi:circadian clock protein KaiC|nr:ATPase domain-containing protein [Usitatibacter sp.]